MSSVQNPEYCPLATAVDQIIARAGPKLIVGLPLGLGKPNHLINALCARVTADPSLSMVLYTALSLDVPQAKPGLESAFATPFLDRHFGGDYPVSRVSHIATIQ